MHLNITAGGSYYPLGKAHQGANSIVTISLNPICVLFTYDFRQMYNVKSSAIIACCCSLYTLVPLQNVQQYNKDKQVYNV